MARQPTRSRLHPTGIFAAEQGTPTDRQAPPAALPPLQVAAPAGAAVPTLAQAFEGLWAALAATTADDLPQQAALGACRRLWRQGHAAQAWPQLVQILEAVIDIPLRRS